MYKDGLKALLEAVRGGSQSVDDAMQALRTLPFEDLEDGSTVDHHRALRQGVPEIIYGEGKTAEQILSIAAAIVAHGENVFATRVSPDKAEALRAAYPEMRYSASARVVSIEIKPVVEKCVRPVAVLSAGTSDLPVAEECCETLRILGVPVQRTYDVGVAGIHRLLHKMELVRSASAVVVVAGMEGALASVVGGLVDIPVIAVPTSVGYGVAEGGHAALNTMLSSCASGIAVMNIDNGFGAAFAVARIVRTLSRELNEAPGAHKR